MEMGIRRDGGNVPESFKGMLRGKKGFLQQIPLGKIEKTLIDPLPVND